MEKLQIERLRDSLQSFDFKCLFIEELGWSHARGAQSIAVPVRENPWRAIPNDPAFAPIAIRAARLTCTTPEFDDLAKEVGLVPSPPAPLPGGEGRYGATDPVERARLRAELDGLIAHLYGLTEAEFAHILGTFPLVAEPVKIAALNAYRDVERGLVK